MLDPANPETIRDIVFEEAAHRYYDRDSEWLPSVTAVLEEIGPMDYSFLPQGREK
jgi:hypothetical protein